MIQIIFWPFASLEKPCKAVFSTPNAFDLYLPVSVSHKRPGPVSDMNAVGRRSDPVELSDLSIVPQPRCEMFNCEVVHTVFPFIVLAV